MLLDYVPEHLDQMTRNLLYRLKVSLVTESPKRDLLDVGREKGYDFKYEVDSYWWNEKDSFFLGQAVINYDRRTDELYLTLKVYKKGCPYVVSICTHSSPSVEKLCEWVMSDEGVIKCQDTMRQMLAEYDHM